MIIPIFIPFNDRNCNLALDPKDIAKVFGIVSVLGILMFSWYGFYWWGYNHAEAYYRPKPLQKVLQDVPEPLKGILTPDYFTENEIRRESTRRSLVGKEFLLSGKIESIRSLSTVDDEASVLVAVPNVPLKAMLHKTIAGARDLNIGESVNCKVRIVHADPYATSMAWLIVEEVK